MAHNYQANITPDLGSWQKKQAAMLYYFSSLEYLEPLHKMVSDILDNVADPAISLAKNQGRDRQLVSKRWGNRDTSENWANNAWPFLKDLQVSLASNIATRRYGEYHRTAMNDCLRGVDEYSTSWMTDREEQKLKQTLARLSSYSLPHDHTVDSYQNHWNDYTFFIAFQDYAKTHTAIPKFRVRPEISAFTGEPPPSTGVYIAQDDPHASLQFIWTNPAGVHLREAKTFNEIGLAALAEVGRQNLWRNASKMFDFAMHEKYASLFREWILDGDQQYPSAAAATVASSAFRSVSRKWFLVEVVPGESELLQAMDESVSDTMKSGSRIEGGTSCHTSGYYFTPSLEDSRRFLHAGEIAPKLPSAYGTMYWQWASNQTTPTDLDNGDANLTR
jgi:hypothetical protein